VMLPQDAAEAAGTIRATHDPATASARQAAPVADRRMRVTPPWCVSRPSVRW
jgi:hypothetical protein